MPHKAQSATRPDGLTAATILLSTAIRAGDAGRGLARVLELFVAKAIPRDPSPPSTTRNTPVRLGVERTVTIGREI
jgi:hypothetical protein